MDGTFYIVPTPIGNLGDVTFRAVVTLKGVDLVLCENTSVTQKLFEYYGISVRTSVFFAQSKLKNINKILQMLKDGKQIALVSDAGTPTISDPGVLLVDRIRKELPDVKIVSLPGPSAFITALSASGISSSNFIFYGFLPHKKGRETIFKEIKENKITSVFYESVHRILKTLESLSKVLDDKRQVVIGRELTKIHEEVVRGGIKEIVKYFKVHKDHIKGEFVVIVSGKH